MATLCISDIPTHFSVSSAAVSLEEDLLGEQCLHSLIGTLLHGFQEIKQMVDGTEVRLENVLEVEQKAVS